MKDHTARILKDLRQASGLSQEKLAAKADMSARYYQSIEAGQQMPSLDILFKIALALGVDIDEIMHPLWNAWMKDQSRL